MHGLLNRSILVFLVSSFWSLDTFADLSSGLVAYLPLNGNANDVSGNGNSGILYGYPISTSDIFLRPNCAIGFDGINDYIALPNANSLQTQNITLSMWINPQRYSVEANVGYVVLSDYGWANGPYAGYIFYLDNHGKISMRLHLMAM